MCQDSVYQYLKANKGWHKAKTIAKKLGISNGSVMLSLKKMHWQKFVKRKSLALNQARYVWKVD